MEYKLVSQEDLLAGFCDVLATADHRCSTCVGNIVSNANALLEELESPWRFFFDEAPVDGGESRVVLVPPCVEEILLDQARRLNEARIAEWRAREAARVAAVKKRGPRGAKLPKRQPRPAGAIVPIRGSDNLEDWS